MFSDEPTVDLDKDHEIIALLAERWPRCFVLAEDRRLPLKVGIFHDLKAALGGKVSPDQLSRALGTYCSAPDYQRHLKDGAARIDLDGQRAGTVTRSEAMWARAGRAERRDKHQRKRASTVKRSSLADLRAAGAGRSGWGRMRGFKPDAAYRGGGLNSMDSFARLEASPSEDH
jgi:ProP effector